MKNVNKKLNVNKTLQAQKQGFIKFEEVQDRRNNIIINFPLTLLGGCCIP